jgi:hypothetical protein
VFARIFGFCEGVCRVASRFPGTQVSRAGVRFRPKRQQALEDVRSSGERLPLGVTYGRRLRSTNGLRAHHGHKGFNPRVTDLRRGGSADDTTRVGPSQGLKPGLNRPTLGHSFGSAPPEHLTRPNRSRLLLSRREAPWAHALVARLRKPAEMLCQESTNSSSGCCGLTALRVGFRVTGFLARSGRTITSRLAGGGARAGFVPPAQSALRTGFRGRPSSLHA